MKLPLAIILGLLLSQLCIAGASAPCDMNGCHDERPAPPPAVTSCCAAAETAPRAMQGKADCACSETHSRQPAPAVPLRQPRESRLDMQAPVAAAMFIPPRRVVIELVESARRRPCAIPSHNTVQALKGIWRT